MRHTTLGLASEFFSSHSISRLAGSRRWRRWWQGKVTLASATLLNSVWACDIQVEQEAEREQLRQLADFQSRKYVFFYFPFLLQYGLIYQGPCFGSVCGVGEGSHFLNKTTLRITVGSLLAYFILFFIWLILMVARIVEKEERTRN